MNFSLNLKTSLKSIGITQKELSSKVGISQSLISEYLSDKKRPSAENAKKFANFLGVSLDWLMGGDEAGVVREPGATYEAGGLTEKIRQLSKEDQKTIEALVDHLQKRGANDGGK